MPERPGVEAADPPANAPSFAPREAKAPNDAPATTPEPRYPIPPRRTAWAELLQRVFEVDALRCPKCGAALAQIQKQQQERDRRRLANPKLTLRQKARIRASRKAAEDATLRQAAE